MTFDPAQIWVSLPMPVLILDQSGAITDLNPASEQFLNIGRRQALGRRFRDCAHPEQDLEPAIERAYQAGAQVYFHDARLLSKNRQPVLCDLQFAPLGDIADQSLVVIHANRIKGRLGLALKAQSVAKTAIGLSDMLAHEIKNPLAGITGAAQLLSMNLGNADRELTDLILQETRRIVDLLKQVEQFGDLRKPELKPLNIHDILERSRMSATMGAAKTMTFYDEYDPSLPPILGDADQLQQCFLNLFANAADAAGADGGSITIRTYYELGLRLGSRDQGKAVPLQVEIIDDGPGIPERIADSVFDPFVSGRENGTGLGLALVSKIIAAHDGSIVVNSGPGRTVFRISLPVAGRSTPEKGE